MKYMVICLWESSPYQITHLLDDLYFDDIHGCQVTMITFTDSYCQTKTVIVPKHPQAKPLSCEVWVHPRPSISWVVTRTTRLVFYGIPTHVIDSPVDYHHWIWGQPSTERWILLPNLNNDPRYYFQLKLKSFLPVSERHLSQVNLSRRCLHPKTRMKFYLDTPYPITIYDQERRVVVGQNLTGSQGSDLSDDLDWHTPGTYYVSCNELISRHLPPVVRISIAIYYDQTFLFSDQLIFHVAPLLLSPATVKPRQVFLSEMEGIQNNQIFLKEVTSILKKCQQPHVIIRNPQISMYHRWLQDIMTFGYVTDGRQTLPIVLKGPHFSRHTQEGTDVSYLYQYLKKIPVYDLFFEQDHNLDAFGNVQVIPPMLPEYPMGRILYGISTNEQQQPNISYNLVDLLESQQVQKPVRIPTGWLHVGHVDEVVSFLPDSRHRYGFRVLMASTRQFEHLLRGLDSNTVLFDSPETFYVFQQASTEITQRFKGDKGSQCVFKSQLHVKDLLSWTDLVNENQGFQRHLDQIQHILINELQLTPQDFFPVPVYYWPRSISPRAKSILPNMINHLQAGSCLVVPKPYGPVNGHQDVFEQAFRTVIPPSFQVHFISNWDCYYLLEGDIHCGTNVQRQPIPHPWWAHPPPGSYNI